MRVIKVLNNSLVLALDSGGQEIILMGKGIGFNKAVGYELKEKEIEKVFVLKDRETSKSIIRLAAETDSVFFELAKSVIDYAVETFHMELMEHIYLALTDHLAFAAARIKDGIVLQNFYTLDMKRFNPNEFLVGEYAVSLMRERLGLELPLDEAGNIAFHFINAQTDNPYNGKNRIINGVVEDVLNIVKYRFGLIYKEESTAYSRFVTHLRLFAQRLVKGQMIPGEESDVLYEQIIKSCAQEFSCVKQIEIYTKEKFGAALTNQEELYLTIHIHRIIEENNPKCPVSK